MKVAREKKSELVKQVKVDTTTEIIVIAAVIADDRIRKKYINIPADYFMGPSHAEMWACLQELFRQGLEYSKETIKNLAAGKFEVDTLDEYVRSYPAAPANIKYHVDYLKWSKKRADATKGVVPVFLDALQDPTSDPERVASLASQVAAAFKGGELRYLRSAEIVSKEHSVELSERRAGRALYPFGIEALDKYTEEDGPELAGKPRMVPGLAPGMITAFTGASGSGKTTVTARIVAEQIKLKKKVLWGAWEQSSGLSLELVAMLNCEFSRSDIMSGNFTEDEQKELERAMEETKEYLKFFELPFGRSRGDKNERFNDTNIDLIHQYIAESGCDLFIGDVFKYALREMRPDDESAAIKRMKAISMEHRCHSMLVHHLNLKQQEGSLDKRPTRAIVMGSSGWVNDTDNVLALYLPGLSDGRGNDRLEIHILKQRFGRWPQAVEFRWKPEWGWFDGGRTIDVSSGNDEEVDDLLDFAPKNNNKKSGGWVKRT